MRVVALVVLSAFSLTTMAQTPNKLSAPERRAGYQLLFDGTSMKGWHRYNGPAIGEAWKVQDGTLMFDGAARKSGASGGDIVTDEEFEDFDFTYEWKISPKGNSGVMFHVVESPEHPTPWVTGPEMQVLDDDGHPDGKINKHRSGDLYDLIASPARYARPVGEWNQARIVSQKGVLTLYLNGQQTAKVERFTPAWNELVAGSKFNSRPAFGKAASGRIALQDHGDTVWYRNLKIRRL